ncbi:MAG TPA: serine--tRNA ligase, partial [Thermoplasmata archaeon]|nr:serine--tRNA ligase [Thermoplasmata archaeon]
LKKAKDKKNIERVKALIQEMSETKKEIEKLGEEEERLKKERDSLLMRIPNILHESVPVGEDEKDNVPVRYWGEIKEFDFELKPNGVLAEALDNADFERASKVAGTGFVYVKNELVILDLSLQYFGLKKLMEKGYVPLYPPLMLRRRPYEGVTDLADFENVMYKIENDDLYLIATSEHAIGAMYMDEILEEGVLPLKFAGISPCFRREVGAHGIDTRGFFRLHQFNKIEQFVFCKPEESWDLHEEMISNAEAIFQSLEIPYRVVNVCTGDIGTVAAKKYDLEVYSPRQKKYIEAVSCSNCTSYQARRLNIRYRKKGGENEFVHTLNSTAIATSRALVAILENNQREDGSVAVPKVLHSLTGFKEIVPKNVKR